MNLYLKLAGKWFEIERLPSSYEIGLKCGTTYFNVVNSTQLIVSNFATEM